MVFASNSVQRVLAGQTMTYTDDCLQVATTHTAYALAFEGRYVGRQFETLEMPTVVRLLATARAVGLAAGAFVTNVTIVTGPGTFKRTTERG